MTKGGDMVAQAMDYDEAIAQLDEAFVGQVVGVSVWSSDAGLEFGVQGVLRRVGVHDPVTGSRDLELSAGQVVLHRDAFAGASWERQPTGPVTDGLVKRALRIALDDGREIEIAES